VTENVNVVVVIVIGKGNEGLVQNHVTINMKDIGRRGAVPKVAMMSQGFPEGVSHPYGGIDLQLVSNISRQCNIRLCRVIF